MTSKSKMIQKIALRGFQGLFFLASCLLLPASSFGQSPVNVTATIKDSAGIPYSNATVSILLIPTGTAPTVGGAQISGTNNGQLDVNGKLNVSLYKNTDIVPASSQWQFTICETPGVAPPLGTGGQCFTSSQTVSAAVDFSTQFQAAAKALSTVTLGAGSVTHTGGALTANLPVIGAGGADIAVGTRTGNTTQYPTWTGAATAARCVDTDASGNLQVTTLDCGGGSIFPVAVSGTVNSGGIPCFTSTTNEASSSLLVQYGILQGGGAGVCPSTVSPPTTPNGVSFPLTSTPSGGLAAPSVFSWPGVPINSQSGTTYTFALTDVRGGLTTFNNGSPVAVTLPQCGSTNFLNNPYFAAQNINNGLVSITPTISTFNGLSLVRLTKNYNLFGYCDNSNYFGTLIPGFQDTPPVANNQFYWDNTAKLWSPQAIGGISIASGTPTFVNTCNGTAGTGTTVSCTFGSNVTAGNIILVSCGNNSGNATTGVADTVNTYVQLSDATATQRLNTWWAKAITTVAPTVTCTFSGSSTVPVMTATSYSGANTVAPLDQQSTTTGSGATANGTAMSTTTNANDLIVGVIQDLSCQQGFTFGAGNTSRVSNNWNMWEDRNVTSVGAYATNFTHGGGCNWIMNTVALIASTSGADPGGLSSAKYDATGQTGSIAAQNLVASNTYGDGTFEYKVYLACASGTGTVSVTANYTDDLAAQTPVILPAFTCGTNVQTQSSFFIYAANATAIKVLTTVVGTVNYNIHVRLVRLG